MARVAMYFEYFQSRREKELNDQLRKLNHDYKEVIVTHKRNEQNSSTAENAQESGNIDYEWVAGEFLGTK